MVFALLRCHFYTFGRPVKILTDHRSLLGLVDSDLEQMTPRLRRFTERLFPYALTWEHIPGKENFIPDYLSPMSPVRPDKVDTAEALTFDAADSRFTKLLLGGGPFYEQLAAASLDDSTFQFLRRCVHDGWPRRPPAHLPLATKYWPLRFKLRVSGPFLLLEDDRVCVPSSLTTDALRLFHQGHPGLNGMSAKARRVVYWPGWSRDMHNFIRACVPCATQAAAIPRPTFFFEPPPMFPGDHVASDHFVFGPESYLACVDVFSGCPFVYKCRSATAASLLTAVQSVFLQTGLPRVFLSDNGGPFVSHEFRDFLRHCNVRHRLSSPQFPQSNGAAERAVRTLKMLRAKSSTPFELFRAVLEFQNTPRAPSQVSPAELFFGRTQRTWSGPVPSQTATPWTAHHASLVSQQKRQH